MMAAQPGDLLRQWSSITGVAALAIAGEVLIASAMRDLGDLDNHRTGPGLKGFLGPVKAVLSNGKFLIGASCMAFNFFAMLWALSIVDLSLAAPAIASLTYIGNAICAKLVLGENVDQRRWLAVLFVCVGVILIAH
ncbi:MAG: EamA family transporter [Edaphobacter sp.]|uniref:EamA family transporter n=1 Tax=Edaphobacter sp. TaxID=1934404 RepID=UPI00238C2F2A|nr:EamA family transporter [Edaphobacter sp.]MDE1176287.1 EamA family transporter [Edaphobacter sp.]